MSALASRLNYAWRMFATALSFTIFGIGGPLLSLTLFPLARLLALDRERARNNIQYILHASWRCFIFFMRITGILTWELRGGERLMQRGRLIIANHPSLLDVVFLISLMPRVDCIVKLGIFKNPFMRWPAAWAGYIPNGEAEQLIADCTRSLRSGHSLLMFPEGTRTRPGQPVSLRRGAAQIALAADAEILPVTITVVPTTLTKGEPWYHIPPRPFHVTVSVGEPVPSAQFLRNGASRALAARHLTEHFEAYFTQSALAQTQQAVAAQTGLYNQTHK
jgi:1-acyl-sn-glycerol-3-phosphate acyltransferase